MYFPPKFYTRAFAFFIFVNGLNNLTKVLDPVFFTDDSNLFCSENNVRTLFETANQELNQINDWFFANKLSQNISYFINI